MACGSFYQTKMSYSCFQNLVAFLINVREYCSALKNCNFLISQRLRMLHSHCNVLSEYVTNILGFKSSREFWLFHMFYCFNFKKVLHRTRYMWYAIIIPHTIMKEKETPITGTKIYDINELISVLYFRPSVCTSDPQKGFSNDMKVRTSKYAHSSIHLPRL